MGEVVLGSARVSEGVQGHEKACKCMGVHARNVRTYKRMQDHIRSCDAVQYLVRECKEVGR